MRDEGERFEIEFVREIVDPHGGRTSGRNVIHLDRLDADELEAEAAELGFTILERRTVPADRRVRRIDGGDAACLSHTLRICALYPDLMNIYADRGNLLLLERRCGWRGIGFEVTAAGLGEAIDPDAHDLFYLGGGQDRDQLLCAQDLVETKRDALHAAAAGGQGHPRRLRRLPAARARLRVRRRGGARASGSSTCAQCAVRPAPG